MTIVLFLIGLVLLLNGGWFAGATLVGGILVTIFALECLFWIGVLIAGVSKQHSYRKRWR